MDSGSTIHKGENVKKRFRLLGSLLALSLVAAACGSDSKSSSSTSAQGSATTTAASTGGSTPGTSGTVSGGEITIALGSEPTSLDPYLVDDGAERAVNDNIYE